MEMPNVLSTIRDPRKNITYQVVAYRSLSREEMVMSVRQFLSQKGKPKVKPGSTVKIISIIGFKDYPLNN